MGEQAVEWLRTSGLAERPRLSRKLRVSRRWRRAVELVLGDFVEATSVDGVASLARADELAPGLMLVEGGETSAERGTLLGEVRGAGAAAGWLGMVRTAPDVSAALSAVADLGEGESVITPQGVWLGRGWLRVAGDQGEGALEREEEIAALETVLEDSGNHAAPALDIPSGESARAELQARLERLSEDLETAVAEQKSIAGRKPDAAQDMQAMRARTAEARERSRDLERREAELESQRQAALRACERIAADITDIEARIGRLRTLREQSIEALDGARHNLKSSLRRKPEIDRSLDEARKLREQADSALAAAESGRAAIQRRLAEKREQLGESRVDQREIEVRRDGLSEQMAATGHELEEVLEELPADLNAEELDLQLEKIGTADRADSGRSISRRSMNWAS